MKPQGKKSLNIDIELHKQIGHESVETGRDMYELVAEAWSVYKAQGPGTGRTTPVVVKNRGHITIEIKAAHLGVHEKLEEVLSAIGPHYAPIIADVIEPFRHEKPVSVGPKADHKERNR